MARPAAAGAYLEEVFGIGGLFAKAFPGYEPRPGQVELARAIDAAFASEKHLLAEGPCGTGKSVAYLVPAIHHAVTFGRKVVVATANIALQEQLVHRDLPMLAKVLPYPFRFSLVKGKRNYLCPARLLEANDLGLLGSDAARLERLISWAERSQTGDVSELESVPEEGLWSQACGTDGECDRHRCIATGCFAQRARDGARRAHVIVTNYHLFLSDLTTVDDNGKRVILPEYDYVICDEGHEMADCARAAFGFELHEGTFEKAASDLKEERAERLGVALLQEGQRFLDAARAFARSNHYRARLRTPNFVDGEPLRQALGAAVGFWALRKERLEGRAGYDRAKGRLHELEMLARHMGAVLNPNLEDAAWIDLGPSNRVTLCSQPVRVGPVLEAQLFGKVRSAVVTSATVTTGGSFGYVREEVGLSTGAELVVASPFDHRRQALLVIPEMESEPNDPGFEAEMEGLLARMLDLMGGRTLALFTSHRAVRHAQEVLRGSSHRILVQGTAPRTLLLEKFRKDVASVLLATQSFWVGVDVPGESLSCVTIDRLPFPRPDDPIIDALAQDCRGWFRRYALPPAVMALRQAVGRLIRARADRGVIVIFDKRLITRPYGELFLESLPPMRLERRLEEVTAFMGERRAA